MDHYIETLSDVRSYYRLSNYTDNRLALFMVDQDVGPVHYAHSHLVL